MCRFCALRTCLWARQVEWCACLFCLLPGLVSSVSFSLVEVAVVKSSQVYT